MMPVLLFGVGHDRLWGAALVIFALTWFALSLGRIASRNDPDPLAYTDTAGHEEWVQSFHAAAADLIEAVDAYIETTQAEIAADAARYIETEWWLLNRGDGRCDR